MLTVLRAAERSWWAGLSLARLTSGFAYPSSAPSCLPSHLAAWLPAVFSKAPQQAAPAAGLAPPARRPRRQSLLPRPATCLPGVRSQPPPPKGPQVLQPAAGARKGKGTLAVHFDLSRTAQQPQDVWRRRVPRRVSVWWDAWRWGRHAAAQAGQQRPLLRDPGRAQGRDAGRAEEVPPEAGAQVPPGQGESEGQSGGGGAAQSPTRARVRSQRTCMLTHLRDGGGSWAAAAWGSSMQQQPQP